MRPSTRPAGCLSGPPERGRGGHGAPIDQAGSPEPFKAPLPQGIPALQVLTLIPGDIFR